MHAHVAWVKIKLYSSLAASPLSCLSPSQDMAAIQPRKPGEVPRISQHSQIRPSGDSGEVLHRSATRFGFPTDHKLCTDAAGLEFCWIATKVLTEAPLHPPWLTHTQSQYSPLLCAWSCESFADSWFLKTIVRQRVNIFWKVVFFFWEREWIHLNERQSVRKKKDHLAWRSEGSLHVPADMYIIAEWCRGSECCWPWLGREAYTLRAT